MYYSLVSTNGFGIYDSKEKIKNSFLKKPILVEFENYLEAVEYTVDTYNDCQMDYDNKYFPDSYYDLKRNWDYYKNSIRKENLKSLDC